MRCVIQRVIRAAVTINGSEKREIGAGLVVLVGFHSDDIPSDIEYMIQKICGLRIFSDGEGKMNLSVLDIPRGNCLVVSQFTLYGDARKGRRPSFTEAAPPPIAIPLYNDFLSRLKREELNIQTGEFGADMLVEIANDGPVTLLLDSKKLF